MSSSFLIQKFSKEYSTINFDLPVFNRETATKLSVARNQLAATTVGNYALFGGGTTDSSSDVVDAYTSSLVRSTPTALSVARYGLASTSIGDYALFGGGNTSSSQSDVSNVVDAYNTSLTRTTPTALSVERSNLASTSIGNYALFGGGQSDSTSNVVDAYDNNLTRTTPTELSVARSNLSATSIGNYALFGGGQDGSTNFDTVDAYSFKRYTVQVYPGTKYKFSNMPSELTSNVFQEINITGQPTGYIKIKNTNVN